MNWASNASAIRRASVVLPLPGRPPQDHRVQAPGFEGDAQAACPGRAGGAGRSPRRASSAAAARRAARRRGRRSRVRARSGARSGPLTRAAPILPRRRRVAARDIRCSAPVPASRSTRMTRSTFAAISAVLVDQFHVDAATVQPQVALDQLGLDSLALMEFVFAVEDRFDVRIPEDRLDPRQAGVTLEQLAPCSTRRSRRRRAAMSSAARSRAGVPVAVTGGGVVSPIGNDARCLRRGALRRPLRRPRPRARPARHRRAARCRSPPPISTPRP